MNTSDPSQFQPDDVPAQESERFPPASKIEADDSELSLEQSLVQLLSSTLGNLHTPHLEALCARLGWPGSDPITLQEAGKMAGITRERVRQIEARVKRVASRNVPAAVQRMVAHLPRDEPELWSRIAHRLKQAGVTQTEWSSKSAKTVLDQCGLNEWTFVDGERDSIVGPVDNVLLNRLDETVSVARRACRASGAVSLGYIVGCLKSPVSVKNLRDMLLCTNDIEFISDEYCWVPRTPAKRVRIQNVAKKMLSINRPLSVTNIQKGLKRKFSFRNKTGNAKYVGVVPPKEVLTALFKIYPQFRVGKGYLIDYIGKLSHEDELTKPERAIVGAFRKWNAKALDRQTIKEFGDDEGINMSSLEVEMTYSPIVEQIRQNVWKLVGDDVADAEVEYVQQQVKQKGQQRRLIDKGLLPNGDFRIVFKLPRFVHNFVASVPSEIGGFKLDETFRTSDGVTLRCKNGAIFGFGKFLSKSNCEEGNYLIIDLNLENRLFRWAYTPQQPPVIRPVHARKVVA